MLRLLSHMSVCVSHAVSEDNSQNLYDSYKQPLTFIHVVSAFVSIFTVEGTDFITPNFFNVTFGAGTVLDTSACVSIPTIDDNSFEDNHGFTVSIDSTTRNITIGTPSSVIPILLDNEGVFKVILT